MKEEPLLFPWLMDNVQLPAGSTPAPRDFMEVSGMPDREKVIKGLQNLRDAIATDFIHEADQAVGTIDDALALLKEQEEIIHCKDCYYYHKHEYGFTSGDCTYRTAWYPVTENEFCSLAKRKEGR